jgi:hypothetical protein
MTKIRARRAGERYVYIHNDLSNAAFYFKEIIEKKRKEGGAGIGLDCMACLVMLAFTFEANINFLGDHFIKGWKEMSPFKSKVKRVFDAFGVEQDQSKRPYSSVILAKTLRDTLAHGKPIKEKFDEIVEGTQEELEARARLIGEWEDQCNPETAFMVYEDMDSLWKELVKAAKLDLWDTITRGKSDLTVIEGLVDA